MTSNVTSTNVKCYLRIYELNNRIEEGEQRDIDPFDEESVWWLVADVGKHYSNHHILFEAITDSSIMCNMDITNYLNTGEHEYCSIVNQSDKIGLYHYVMNIMDHDSIMVNEIDKSTVAEIIDIPNSSEIGKMNISETRYVRIYDLTKYRNGECHLNPNHDDCVWWLTIGNEPRYVNYRILLEIQVSTSTLDSFDFNDYINHFTVCGETNTIKQEYRLEMYYKLMKYIEPKVVFINELEEYFY